METFNNDKKLKASLVRKLKHHQKLDTFIQGNWLTDEKVKGNGFKGCFYGCTMQSNGNPIQEFSDKYNVDLWYCHLTENIFEGLPDGEYQKFPLESIQIIPICFDFNKIKSRFFYNILMDKEHGQINYCKGNEKCIDAIKQCADLFKVGFDEIARSAAYSARSADSAAYSAARSADSAARSADSAARSAAYSAAYSAARSAYSAAKQQHYVWMRDMLFKLIK